jgi:hypothetical protein
LNVLPLFCAAAALVALTAASVPTYASTPPPQPAVVASYRLALKEAPDAIVPSNDGHVWIASNAAQAFIRIDALTGAQSTYHYDKGGASVEDAAAGDSGSLWYLDGLNTEDIWRIESDGRFGGIPVGDPGKVRASTVASINGDHAIATISPRNELIPFDSSGLAKPISLPAKYVSPGIITVSADSTAWFTINGGIAWRTPSNTFGSTTVADVAYLTACGDSSAATMSWTGDPRQHADDYRITWVDTAGGARSARRWPAPPPPSPNPRPSLHSISVVTCGMCGGIVVRRPQRSLQLLRCTPSTAWVQIDERLDWLASNQEIRSFDLGALISEGVDDQAAAEFPDAQHVWVYSVKSQRLVEIQLR